MPCAFAVSNIISIRYSADMQSGHDHGTRRRKHPSSLNKAPRRSSSEEEALRQLPKRLSVEPELFARS